jgi:hypothetical protein
VQEYTSRSTTKPQDKLPALSGIIDTLQQMSGDVCYAALWKRHFVKSLLWEIVKDSPNGARAHRPSKWRAPSWSFASIDGCVEYSWESSYAYCQSEEAILVKLEECNVVPVNLNNPLGELKSVSMMFGKYTFGISYSRL